jgi:putative ABC transport system ATP-binding protein
MQMNKAEPEFPQVDAEATPMPSRQAGPRHAALQVSGLGKQVLLPSGPLVILEDIGFDIARGDTVAIVGASGSGKSTLLALMAGLDTPTAGHVLVDGKPMSSLDEDGRARVRGEQIGFVFQNFQLLPSLTALENVMLPLELRVLRQAQDTRSIESLAREILDQVGLGARLDHYPRQLSGGEQQRVALARAFVTRPSLLFADEPTGNLDTRTGQAIIELLFDLNAAAGTTLVLVTHDENLAVRCAHTLRLDGGRLMPS